MSLSVEGVALGAVRCVDGVTGLDVGRTLSMAAEGVAFVRDRQGLIVLTRAVGGEATPARLDGEAAVAAATVEICIHDPSGRYLPRRFALALPGDAAGDRTGGGAAAAHPACVAMYLAPGARPAPGSAVLRVRVTDQATPRGLGGALVRVTGRAAGRRPWVLGRGLTDGRGEALVAIPGPPAQWDGKGGRGTLSPEIDAHVTAIVDARSLEDALFVPDPDALEGQLNEQACGSTATGGAAMKTVHQKISWGRETAMRISIPLG